MNIPEVEDIIAYIFKHTYAMILIVLLGFLFGTGVLLSLEFYPIWRP